MVKFCTVLCTHLASEQARPADRVRSRLHKRSLNTVSTNDVLGRWPMFADALEGESCSFPGPRTKGVK